MKKNIYFVQPNSMLGNSVYYPYAVGVIASYAFQYEDIKNGYELGGIVFKEDAAEDVMKHLESPYLVAFSNYFWNYKYNLALAEEIKKEYPDCIIIFGGHQVSKDTVWLEKHKFIDILCFGEGEITFLRLLRALADNEPLSSVANIAYRENGEIFQNEYVCLGADGYPSPYQSGVFDKLLNVPEGLEFNAQLETNRGCPYHCSFCDWCDYDLPMRMFPLERVKADLKWISEHKIAYCMCVDSNFGLFERDEEIAGYAVELKKQSGYPDKFGACFAKNKTDRIFRINKALNDVGMSKGVSLAFQSMSDEVLKNVSRANMNKDKLFEQLALYHEAGIPTYTELILGLPGETLESFCTGICELLELGQHDSINVFRCEVYPNSDLADKEYMERFAIKTAVNKLNTNHCKISEASFSGELHYISETSTMTPEDLADANLFSACIQSVHCHGPLQCFAIYLHNDKKISYYDFYSSFISYFSERDGMIGEILRKIKSCIISNGGENADISYINPEFRFITWPYEEAMLLDFIYNSEAFYGEVRPFLKGFDMDSDIMENIMRYQKNLMVTMGENNAFADFEYDLYSYFKNALENKPSPLMKEKCRINFFADNVPSDWENFARQIVWYGRRNKKSIRGVRLAAN